MSYFDEAIEKMKEKLQVQKMDLLKSALRIKGFSDLADGLKTSRFPRVAEVNKNGWSYYFADDGTNDGMFIIAISDIEVVYNTSDPLKVVASIQHHSDPTLVHL